MTIRCGFGGFGGIRCRVCRHLARSWPTQRRWFRTKYISISQQQQHHSFEIRKLFLRQKLSKHTMSSNNANVGACLASIGAGTMLGIGGAASGPGQFWYAPLMVANPQAGLACYTAVGLGGGLLGGAALHKPFHGPALSLSEMANPDKSCAWWDQTVA